MVKPLHHYRVYGIVLAIDEPLHSLQPVGPVSHPDLTLSFAGPSYFHDRVPPARIVRPEGDWIAHAFLDDGSFYLDAPHVVQALLSPDGRRGTCVRGDAADRRTVEANLLNIVIASALTLAGEEPLHGTAVEIGGRAIGLLGPSGAGKSTLAAMLIRDGARLLTDDVLRVELVHGRAIAFRGPHRLKLFEEPARRYMPDRLAEGDFNALSGKMMFRPSASTTDAIESLPLAAFYFLGDFPQWPPPTDARAIRLSGVDIAQVLMSSAMDDRNTSPRRLSRQLQYAGLLSAAVPMYALRYPRRFALMDDVAAQIYRTAMP